MSDANIKKEIYRMPPKLEFSQVTGMALSMTKLMLNGRMAEVFDTVKANYKHLKDVL
ncbi:hypothetical protein [Mucilaginibacter conchicola]|uniref:hypothetical protein n=1 Tax=Mucilaginibacter conchicola TaxID=2303333 RepID=UPI001314D8D7|nr:hypothetical protein [Mucilaginibacter conchicola]